LCLPRKLSITNLNLKLSWTQYTMKSSRATSRVNVELMSDVSETAFVSSSRVDVMSVRFAPYIYIHICHLSQSRPSTERLTTSNSNSEDCPIVPLVVRAGTGHHYLIPPIIPHVIWAATDEENFVYKCSVRTQTLSTSNYGGSRPYAAPRADPFVGPD
jgi:hypothetical protein